MGARAPRRSVANPNEMSKRMGAWGCTSHDSVIAQRQARRRSLPSKTSGTVRQTISGRVDRRRRRQVFIDHRGGGG